LGFCCSFIKQITGSKQARAWAGLAELFDRELASGKSASRWSLCFNGRWDFDDKTILFFSFFGEDGDVEMLCGLWKF
jgi:hypothetical protein